MAGNGCIIAELEKLEREARSFGDKRLSFTFAKAIKSLKAHPTPIKNGEEAMHLNGIGKFIASKIDEIIAMSTHFSTSIDPTQESSVFALVLSFIRSIPSKNCLRMASKFRINKLLRKFHGIWIRLHSSL